jgi:hypothetical protein
MGSKYSNSLRRMRIRDKHPGSATLVVTRKNCQPEQNIFNQIPYAKPDCPSIQYPEKSQQYSVQNPNPNPHGEYLGPTPQRKAYNHQQK